ncbi:MAG: CPBP family intramembrane metalloprotease [Actinomycetaceae bacterium]|nr:CPBP family intramembrane metalloprotease [Actinomycetaceae bacterium]
MFFLPRTLPSTPAEYELIATGEDKRWWRVLIGVVVGVVAAVPLSLIIFIPFVAMDPTGNTLGTLDSTNIDMTDPVVFSVMMLSLIVLIPAAMLAAIIAFRYRPGYLFSVAGGIRWKWQIKAVVIAIAYFAVIYTALTFLEGTDFHPPAHLGFLILLIVVLTPLQSAAEEIVFRGLVMQVIGALIPHRLIALPLAAVVSAASFALAHGSLDAGILTELGFFALICVFLTWYTGGLEAAIALHAANNVTIFIIEAFEGHTSSIVTAETTSEPGTLAISVLINAVLVALLVYAYRREGLGNRHCPAQRPAPTADYLHSRLLKGEFIPEYADRYPAHISAQYGYHQHYEL